MSWDASNPENEAYLFEEDKCITNLDPEDEFDIDHFWFTFRSAPTIEEEIVMDDFADYLLMIRSKKLGVSTIHNYFGSLKMEPLQGSGTLTPMLLKKQNLSLQKH